MRFVNRISRRTIEHPDVSVENSSEVQDALAPVGDAFAAIAILNRCVRHQASKRGERLDDPLRLSRIRNRAQVVEQHSRLGVRPTGCCLTIPRGAVAASSRSANLKLSVARKSRAGQYLRPLLTDKVRAFIGQIHSGHLSLRIRAISGAARV